MERVKVRSSAISAAAYDEAEQKLETVYHPNKIGIASVWHYKPVAQESFDALLEESRKAQAGDPTASVGRILAEIRRQPGIESYKAGEESAESLVQA